MATWQQRLRERDSWACVLADTLVRIFDCGVERIKVYCCWILLFIVKKVRFDSSDDYLQKVIREFGTAETKPA